MIRLFSFPLFSALSLLMAVISLIPSVQAITYQKLQEVLQPSDEAYKELVDAYLSQQNIILSHKE